jgi:2'-5' RNA ligase
MARRRLGVVVVLDPPWSDEVDGLRRALGERSRTRIAPHVTLIPPVNVRQDDLGGVLALLRRAAATVAGPITVDVGPPATFLPATSVLHLPVTGEGMASLARVRASMLAGPLDRPSPWPWVPHVTLLEGPEDRITAAIAVLADYRVSTTVDRVVLLEQRRSESGARWVPLADVGFGPRVVVGRGGRELELTVGRMLDPEAGALMARSASPEVWPEVWEGADGASDSEAGERGPDGPGPHPVVCTSRREGEVLGVGAAWSGPAGPCCEVVVDPAARGEGIGRHLWARIASVLADAGREMPGPAPAGGYSKTEE